MLLEICKDILHFLASDQVITTTPFVLIVRKKCTLLIIICLEHLVESGCVSFIGYGWVGVYTQSQPIISQGFIGEGRWGGGGGGFRTTKMQLLIKVDIIPHLCGDYLFFSHFFLSQ